MSYGRTDRNETRGVGPGGNVANNVRTASGLNLIAGLWLIVAPFILGYSNLQSTTWNSIIVGILIAGMAGYRIANPHLNPWVSWVVAALGVWVILSPFVYAHSDVARPFWNDIIIGIVVLILGAWSAMSAHETGFGGTTGTTGTRPT